MDFTNRSQQPNRPESTQFAPASVADQAQRQKAAHANAGNIGRNRSKWMRWGSGVGLIIVGLLIAAVVGVLLTARPASEDHFIDNGKLQAVFLTNDQVYFGKIDSINSKYLVLSDIYYLQSSTTNKTSSTNGNVSLVKLGCELHKPQDQMVINQQQVSFWENLQSDGQVAKAVAQYQKANPNGQTCSNGTSTQSNPVQGSSENTPSATPSASTSTNSTSNTKQ